MNREMAIGHWNEWMVAMRERWGRLTNDDWQRIEGDRERLVGVLQQRYGYAREQAEQDVDDFVARRTAVPATGSVISGAVPEPVPVATERVLPYTNDVGYARDEAARAAGAGVSSATGARRVEVRDVPADARAAAEDNGVRAQPGDVLGLDTDGETTSLGDTREDEDRRRVEALREASDDADHRRD